jgi:hypothetical protein
METRFTIYSMLGSMTNFNNLDVATNFFNEKKDSKTLVDNKTNTTIISREHVLCGVIKTGIKHCGDVKIYTLSDTTGEKVTSTGELLEDAMKRFINMDIEDCTKERKFETHYEELS